MKKAFMALILGTALWSSDGFAHDPYYRDWYRWRDRFERRVARPGDPGFYCHVIRARTTEMNLVDIVTASTTIRTA
jgi:hypothetical protein